MAFLLLLALLLLLAFLLLLLLPLLLGSQSIPSLKVSAPHISVSIPA
jgi:hypothetical protein